MNTKHIAFLILVSLVIGFACGLNFTPTPARVETETAKKTDEKKDIKIATKKVITENPDGTKTTTVEKVLTNNSVSSSAEKTNTLTLYPKKVHVFAGYGVNNFKPHDYSVAVGLYKSEVLGPLGVGVQGSFSPLRNNKQLTFLIGVSL